MNENLRIEHDSIGDLEIPVDAYYGVQALRGAENFKITGNMLHPLFIKNMARIKKACAIANGYMGAIDKTKVDAMIAACDEIIAGGLTEAFIVDAIQGGAGTSANMNANEVIANRAIEILGGRKGDYKIVHPNDHVNYGQSTNDVIPTAGKMTVIDLVAPLLASLNELVVALDEKAKRFDGIVKMGRTQLQDAVPIRLGQEFAAYAAVIRRDIDRIAHAEKEMHTVNMGGSAIGTCINVDPVYLEQIPVALTEVAGYELNLAPDLIDATQNLDGFVSVSSALKTCAVNLSKIANDLRLMSSGPRTGIGEILLPAKQNGSSIMPGKINPVMPEVVSQVAFRVIGNDATIAMAVEGGQMELNAFEPIALYSLFQSITMLNNACRVFRMYCIEGITANDERCLRTLLNSTAMATALVPAFGYEKATTIVKKALKEKRAIIEVASEVLGLESGEVRKIFMNCIKNC